MMPTDQKPEAPAGPTVTKVEATTTELPPPPTPTDVIPADLVTTLAEAVNEAASFIMGDSFPGVPVGNPPDAARGIGGTKKPVDPMVWSGLMLVGAVVGKVAESNPAVQDLAFDPNAIATASGMRDVIGKLDQISRSEDVKKAAEQIVADAKAGMEDESGEAPAEQTAAEEAGPEEPEPPAMK